MENEFNKIKNISEKIKLSREEKEWLRGSILYFIKSNPVRNEEASRLLDKGSFFSLFNLLNFNFKPTPAFLGILLVLGASGGVSLAAENALPGDLFYPVKVGVNEEVRAAVSFSAEAKANWDARRLERRLEEAERLAHKKEFSAEARAKVEENFEAHAERVEKRIADFEAKGETESAANLSSNFETSLDAHEKILIKIDGEEINKFLPKVRAKRGNAALLRVKMEARVSDESNAEAKAAAEGKMKSAENKIREVKKLFEKMKERLGEEATAEGEARLGEAQKILAEGKTKVDIKAYGEAFAFFQRAHRIAQEAKLLIEARSEFDADFKTREMEEKENKNSENKEKTDKDAEVNANLNVEVEGRQKGNLDVRFDLGL